MIHPTAVIHPKAKIDPSCEIGPYVVIGEGVDIGEGTVVRSHSVLEGPELKIGKLNIMGPHANIKSHTTVGDHNKIYPFSSIGCEPQDLKFKGENSRLIIGDRNTFRESVTLNRGTEHGGGVTKIGSDNLIMAYAHVAHDCVVGNHVVMANNVALAGHVEIQDHAIIGGLVGVSQFCRVGRYAYIGGCSGLNKDVPPYCLAIGAFPTIIKGINSIGLKRHGLTDDVIRVLKEVYKILYLSDLIFSEAIQKVKDGFIETPQVRELLEFIETSKQGIVGRESTSVPETENSRNRRWVSRELSH